MSIATIIGMLSGFALVITAMILGGSATSFVDGPAMLIVIGGTAAVTLASFSFREVVHALTAMVNAILRSPPAPNRAAVRIMQLAERARRDGVLGLQSVVGTLSSEPILRKAISMVIDGTPGEEVERILRREVVTLTERQRGSVDVFRKAAEVSPAMGLIGTLVGLVQMLGNLADPASIGPAMALALLTTFYGAVLAYMVFSPLASKLERNTDEEALVQNLYVLGAASMGRQENPRRLEVLLNATLPPAHQITYFD